MVPGTFEALALLKLKPMHGIIGMNWRQLHGSGVELEGIRFRITTKADRKPGASRIKKRRSGMPPPGNAWCAEEEEASTSPPSRIPKWVLSPRHKGRRYATSKKSIIPNNELSHRFQCSLNLGGDLTAHPHQLCCHCLPRLHRNSCFASTPGGHYSADSINSSRTLSVVWDK